MAILCKFDGRSERPGKNDEIFSLTDEGGSEVNSKLELKDLLSQVPRGEWISLDLLEELLNDNDFGIDVVTGADDEIVLIDNGPDFIFGAGKIPEEKDFAVYCEDTEYKVPQFVDVEGDGFFSCLTGGSAYDFQRNSELIPQQSYVFSDSVSEKITNLSVLSDSDYIVGGSIGMGRSVTSQSDMRRKDLKKQNSPFVFFRGKRVTYKYKNISYAYKEHGVPTLVSQGHAFEEHWKEVHDRQIRGQRRLTMSREFVLG